MCRCGSNQPLLGTGRRSRDFCASNLVVQTATSVLPDRCRLGLADVAGKLRRTGRHKTRRRSGDAGPRDAVRQTSGGTGPLPVRSTDLKCTQRRRRWERWRDCVTVAGSRPASMALCGRTGLLRPATEASRLGSTGAPKPTGITREGTGIVPESPLIEEHEEPRGELSVRLADLLTLLLMAASIATKRRAAQAAIPTAAQAAESASGPRAGPIRRGCPTHGLKPSCRP